MSSNEPVEQVTWTSKELLEHTLESSRRSIIYRGVKDSNYLLLPYALRDDGKKILKKLGDYYLDTFGLSSVRDQTLRQNDYERLALMWFYDLANQQGIDVPDIPHCYEGFPLMELRLIEDREKDVWPEEGWFEVAALAQHYGIPTRFLDWSYDINAAMYFATYSLKDDYEPDKYITIWELDKAKLSFIDCFFKFVVPKYHGNPNILAQHGVLSVYDGLEMELSEKMSMDQLIKNACSKQAEDFLNILCHDGPVLRRIDISYGEAIHVRDYLKQKGLFL